MTKGKDLCKLSIFDFIKTLKNTISLVQHLSVCISLIFNTYSARREWRLKVSEVIALIFKRCTGVQQIERPTCKKEFRTNEPMKV